MKVFLVSTGSYSDYNVEGIFSTYEKANDFKNYIRYANDIEEYELDMPYEKNILVIMDLRINKKGVFDYTFNDVKVVNGIKQMAPRFSDDGLVNGFHIENLFTESDYEKNTAYNKMKKNVQRYVLYCKDQRGRRVYTKRFI